MVFKVGHTISRGIRGMHYLKKTTLTYRQGPCRSAYLLFTLARRLIFKFSEARDHSDDTAKYQYYRDRSFYDGDSVRPPHYKTRNAEDRNRASDYYA